MIDIRSHKKSFLAIALLFLKGSLLFAGAETSFPMELQGIPFADQQGIILDVKTVPIQGITAPYNAALTTDKNNDYLLVFRYDIKKKGAITRNYIACTALDEKLDQKGSFKEIDTLSDFSNDPRIVKSGSQSFLVYNDTPSPQSQNRIMKIAEFNMSNFQLKNITTLDRKIKKKEKNWIPFSASKEIYFIYTINPYNILKLDNRQSSSVKEMNFDTKPTDFPWSWGPPRGGTQAELVDGEYLTFFHSSFRDNHGKNWYVMGAFTFEAKPPFRITAISPHPIFFKDIYGSPHLNKASNRLRCIFPTGMVLAEKSNKILVSCGENDSAVKIITFDKKALLKSLIPVNPL